jgi:hypothetical protein
MRSEMQEYYNFKVTDLEISYEPYWYHKSNIMLRIILGLIIIITGLLLSHFNICKEALLIGSFFSFIPIIIGLYTFYITSKTTLIFNKTDNSLYKITPLGKKKIGILNKTEKIITKSKRNSFQYILINKKNKSLKQIPVTARIKNKNQNSPEVRFLEMEIIPVLKMFLELNSEFQFSKEDCSPI